MPTIVAICPYCRAGGVRAPQSAVGASATCPKCGSSFTVMPSDGLPGWANQPQPDAAPAGAPAPSTPAGAPTDETRSAAAVPDVTEPSPVLPADERRKKAKPKPAPAAAPAAEPAPEPPETAESPEPADMGLVVALVALILVGVAVLATLFPFGRFIAAGVAALGLVGGLASLGAEGRARQAGSVATGLHAVILLLVLLLPSWLSLGPWRGEPTDGGPTGPVALEHSGGARNPVSPTDWIDATQASWEFKDLRVTVRSAAVAPVELTGPKGAKRTTKEPYLHLLLRVSNHGVEREINLSGWAVGEGADAVRVVDPSGKLLKPAAFDEGWTIDRGKPTEHLFPGKTSDVRLVFAAPPAKTESLRVQLPGAAVGVPEEEIKFRISGGFLTRNAP